MRVIVVGAGGHGQVVADILLSVRRQGLDVIPIGYVDDDPALSGREFLGLPVIGGTERLREVVHDAVIVAIGDNSRRRVVFSALEQQGKRFAIARHPSAVIAAGVTIGPGTAICAGAIVNPGTIIGSNVILNTGCSIDHHNHVGDHVHVGPGVHTGGDVTIGSGSLVGIGATVMPGRTIGANCIVGAASLVLRDADEGTVVAGVPARRIQRHAVLQP